MRAVAPVGVTVVVSTDMMEINSQYTAVGRFRNGGRSHRQTTGRRRRRTRRSRRRRRTQDEEDEDGDADDNDDDDGDDDDDVEAYGGIFDTIRCDSLTVGDVGVIATIAPQKKNVYLKNYY